MAQPRNERKRGRSVLEKRRAKQAKREAKALAERRAHARGQATAGS